MKQVMILYKTVLLLVYQVPPHTPPSLQGAAGQEDGSGLRVRPQFTPQPPPAMAVLRLCQSFQGKPLVLWLAVGQSLLLCFKSYTAQGSPPKWDINGLRPSQASSYSRIPQGSPRPMKQEVNPIFERAAAAKTSTRQENWKNQEQSWSSTFNFNMPSCFITVKGKIEKQSIYVLKFKTSSFFPLWIWSVQDQKSNRKSVQLQQALWFIFI